MVCVHCCGRGDGVFVRVGVWPASMQDGVGMKGSTWIKVARAGRDWGTDPVQWGHSVDQYLRQAFKIEIEIK